MARIVAKRDFLFGVFIGLTLSTFGTVIFYQSPYLINLNHVNTNWILAKNDDNQIQRVHLNENVTDRESLAFLPQATQSKPTKQASTNIDSSQAVAKSKILLSVDELVEAIQFERKATLKSACQRIEPTKSYSVDSGYIHERNFFSRNYKLVSCDIAKCGHTSWMKAVTIMEDLFTIDDYKLKIKINGGVPWNLGNSKFRLKSVKSEDEKKQIWQHSLKVITVRNPFSRLLSAYKAKMLPPRPGPSENYKFKSQKINKQFRHLRHNVTERNQADDGNARFEDFVNYLVTVNNFKTDPHWTSFLGACKPCDAQYDYIIKFDTLNNDMEYLKQKLNISEYHRKAVFPPGNYKTNNDLVEKAFKTIPKKLARNLYEKYRNDFELFGYEMPSWLN